MQSKYSVWVTDNISVKKMLTIGPRYLFRLHNRKQTLPVLLPLNSGNTSTFNFAKQIVSLIDCLDFMQELAIDCFKCRPNNVVSLSPFYLFLELPIASDTRVLIEKFLLKITDKENVSRFPR